MYGLTSTIAAVDEDLTRAAGREAGVDSDAIYPFGDFTRLMEELLKLLYRPSCTLISVGHVTPEIALAANSAEIELIEALGDSPFAGNVAPGLKAVRTAQDIVYLANPNLITGATYSRADLKRLASAAWRGTIIVDERLFGCGGITAVPLLGGLENLVILRSFLALRSASTGNAGFVVAGRDMISAIRESVRPEVISRAVREKILCEGSGDGARATRGKEICHESLRIATELTQLGIQCRTIPTDFLLIRVANVKNTGNFLTANQVTVENLDGYPQMRNYLRYRLESPQMNDRLVDTFRKMPHECYRGTAPDKRTMKFCRRGELSPEKPTLGGDTDLKPGAREAQRAGRPVERSMGGKRIAWRTRKSTGGRWHEESSER